MFAVTRATWTPILNSTSQQLVAVLSDGNSHTRLDLVSATPVDRLLLRGELASDYTTVNVFLEIQDGNVTFEHGNRICYSRPSSLMTHIGPTSGRECKPFCGVPSKCNYGGIMETREDIATHKFTCHCAQDSCKELIFWLWPESFMGNPKICEVRVFPSDSISYKDKKWQLWYSSTQMSKAIFHNSKFIPHFMMDVTIYPCCD